jgi:hypothetical protein
MLKKTLTYTDFNGVEVTEDFYFNLTKAEVAEMEVNASTLDSDGKIVGGMEAMLNDVVASGSGKRIIEVFKEIIKKSIGRKSEDGKYFFKDVFIWNEFEASPAYSDFFVELLTDPDAAADFIRGVMPIDVDPKDVPPPIPFTAFLPNGEVTKIED